MTGTSDPAGTPDPAGVWVLRHGESTANAEGLIVSLAGPRALVEVGLTPRGRKQAATAARSAREAGLDGRSQVVSSDFARAQQTAAVFATGLGAGEVRLERRLRERGFGTFDEGPSAAYDGIWALDRDRQDPGEEVERVAVVAQRVDAVLREADAVAASGVPVVLVAHGDVLQIALAVGEGMDPHDHRDVPHLGNAELRRVGPARLEASP